MMRMIHLILILWKLWRNNMLPYYKIHTRKHYDPPKTLLGGLNELSNVRVKYDALDDYNKKKKEERERIREEIQRVALSNLDV